MLRHFKSIFLKGFKIIFFLKTILRLFKELYELSALQQCLQNTGMGVGGAAGLASMVLYSASNGVAWKNIGRTKRN